MSAQDHINTQQELIVENGNIIKNYIIAYAIMYQSFKQQHLRVTEGSEQILPFNIIDLDLTKPEDLNRLLYKVLEYPMPTDTRPGSHAVRPQIIRTLAVVKNSSAEYNNYGMVCRDLIGADGTAILAADHLNSLAYPIARVLVEFKTLEKELKSFVVPMQQKMVESEVSAKQMNMF